MAVARSGSAQLALIGAALRATGARDLRLELLRGTKEAGRPLVHAVHDAAMAQLPRTGGLNAQVAGQKVTVSVRTGARTAGVRLTTTAPDTAQTDAGFVRKPTWGHRDRWVTQAIPKATGWWSRTLAQSGPLTVPAMLAVQTRVARKIMAAGRL